MRKTNPVMDAERADQPEKVLFESVTKEDKNKDMCTNIP